METEPDIDHWSHAHILQFQPFHVRPHINTSCCTDPALNMDGFYGCEHCNFFIHKKCSELQPFLAHPSHPLHALALIFYPSLSVCVCNGCSEAIVGGFFYRCSDCDFDLHSRCASLSIAVNPVAGCEGGAADQMQYHSEENPHTTTESISAEMMPSAEAAAILRFHRQNYMRNQQTMSWALEMIQDSRSTIINNLR